MSRWSRRSILAAAALLVPAALCCAAPTAPPDADDAANSLRGQLLIASPAIGDPRFYHAVILMVRHDKAGAFGIMINRPIEERTVTSILTAIGKPDDTVEGKLQVYAGGPVELGAGFIIHTADYHHPDTIAIDGRLAVTSNPDVLRDIGHHKGPEKALFAIGYAGWGPGQLEGELARHDWFTAPADLKLVFDDERDAVWDHALAARTRDL
jgi:putative transcriptional regulator